MTSSPHKKASSDAERDAFVKVTALWHAEAAAVAQVPLNARFDSILRWATEIKEKESKEGKEKEREIGKDRDKELVREIKVIDVAEEFRRQMGGMRAVLGEDRSRTARSRPTMDAQYLCLARMQRMQHDSSRTMLLPLTGVMHARLCDLFSPLELAQSNRTNPIDLYLYFSAPSTPPLLRLDAHAASVLNERTVTFTENMLLFISSLLQPFCKSDGAVVSEMGAAVLPMLRDMIPLAPVARKKEKKDEKDEEKEGKGRALVSLAKKLVPSSGNTISNSSASHTTAPGLGHGGGSLENPAAQGEGDEDLMVDATPLKSMRQEDLAGLAGGLSDAALAPGAIARPLVLVLSHTLQTLPWELMLGQPVVRAPSLATHVRHRHLRKTNGLRFFALFNSSVKSDEPRMAWNVTWAMYRLRAADAPPIGGEEHVVYGPFGSPLLKNSKKVGKWRRKYKSVVLLDVAGQEGVWKGMEEEAEGAHAVVVLTWGDLVDPHAVVVGLMGRPDTTVLFVPVGKYREVVDRLVKLIETAKGSIYHVLMKSVNVVQHDLGVPIAIVRPPVRD